MGMGSSVFHPESSRVARMASGGQLGLAQSVFQVGGNLGSSLGPLLAAFIVLPLGQSSVAWFSIAALLGMFVLTNVGRWYKGHELRKSRTKQLHEQALLPRRKIVISLAVLISLIFSKYFYLASFTSYYTFYLMSTFHVTVQSAQIHLFVFGRGRGWNRYWRPGWRPPRAEACYLVLDSGRASVYHCATLRKSLLDSGIERGDRHDSRFSVLGHFGLCPGATSRQSRDDLGSFFRIRFRHGGHRRRSPWRTGGFYKHPFCVRCLFFSSADRPVDWIPAGSKNGSRPSISAGSRREAVSGTSCDREPRVED